MAALTPLDLGAQLAQQAPRRWSSYRWRLLGATVDLMQLLLVAPPGAGKGTQAANLSAHYGIAHLSSGELLRKEVVAGTRTGQIAANYLRRGDLVPDELVLDMMIGPVLDAIRGGGYVLDGFPRTRPQAEEAYRVAQQFDGIELQAVVHLGVRRPELRRRLRTRAKREGRDDDTEVVVEHRLEVFDAETEPLLDFYARRGLVLDIDGEQSVSQVFVDITSAIDRLTVGGLPETGSSDTWTY